MQFVYNAINYLLQVNIYQKIIITEIINFLLFLKNIIGKINI